MTQMEILDAARDSVGGYKVDVSRGERIGRVSSEWFSRSADERSQRKRAALRFVTGWTLSAARHGVLSHGARHSEDHPLALARHPFLTGSCSVSRTSGA
jgi:hypothetical protein